MSGLGKLLIVFNLLAAGAFAYLTLENYKIRKEITFVAFQNEVLLRGVPVEKATQSGDEYSFPFKVNNQDFIGAINSKDLEKLVPNGGPEFGGQPVASLTDEIERLKTSVMNAVNAINGQEKLNRTRTFLLNLSRSGAERDGTIALFDILNPIKARDARRDLPYLGRTSSQVAAMKVLVDIVELGDPSTITPEATRVARIAGARESVRRFALGEVAYGAGTSDTSSANYTTLRNAIDDASKGRGSEQAITSAATADSAGFTEIAKLLLNPLDNSGRITEAVNSVKAFVSGKKLTATEGTAYENVIGLIASAGNAGLVETAAVDLLASKFDECALPALTKDSPKGYTVAEKARRIAHILYHIDADRFAQPDTRRTWHSRVVSLIGLEEYVRVAEAQASENAESVQRLISVISDEESAFVEEYQSNVQRCFFLYSRILALEAQLVNQNAALAENKKLYEERVTERDELKMLLDKSRDDARVSLERLEAKQKEQFNILRDLRDAQRALLVLEKELQRLELNRK